MMAMEPQKSHVRMVRTPKVPLDQQITDRTRPFAAWPHSKPPSKKFVFFLFRHDNYGSQYQNSRMAAVGPDPEIKGNIITFERTVKNMFDHPDKCIYAAHQFALWLMSNYHQKVILVSVGKLGYCSFGYLRLLTQKWIGEIRCIDVLEVPNQDFLSGLDLEQCRSLTMVGEPAQTTSILDACKALRSAVMKANGDGAKLLMQAKPFKLKSIPCEEKNPFEIDFLGPLTGKETEEEKLERAKIRDMLIGGGHSLFLAENEGAYLKQAMTDCVPDGERYVFVLIKYLEANTPRERLHISAIGPYLTNDLMMRPFEAITENLRINRDAAFIAIDHFYEWLLYYDLKPTLVSASSDENDASTFWFLRRLGNAMMLNVPCVNVYNLLVDGKRYDPIEYSSVASGKLTPLDALRSLRMSVHYIGKARGFETLTILKNMARLRLEEFSAPDLNFVKQMSKVSMNNQPLVDDLSMKPMVNLSEFVENGGEIVKDRSVKMEAAIKRVKDSTEATNDCAKKADDNQKKAKSKSGSRSESVQKDKDYPLTKLYCPILSPGALITDQKRLFAPRSNPAPASKKFVFFFLKNQAMGSTYTFRIVAIGPDPKKKGDIITFNRTVKDLEKNPDKCVYAAHEFSLWLMDKYRHKVVLVSISVGRRSTANFLYLSLLSDPWLRDIKCVDLVGTRSMTELGSFGEEAGQDILSNGVAMTQIDNLDIMEACVRFRTKVLGWAKKGRLQGKELLPLNDTFRVGHIRCSETECVAGKTRQSNEKRLLEIIEAVRKDHLDPMICKHHLLKKEPNLGPRPIRTRPMPPVVHVLIKYVNPGEEDERLHILAIGEPVEMAAYVEQKARHFNLVTENLRENKDAAFMAVDHFYKWLLDYDIVPLLVSVDAPIGTPSTFWFLKRLAPQRLLAIHCADACKVTEAPIHLKDQYSAIGDENLDVKAIKAFPMEIFSANLGSGKIAGFDLSTYNAEDIDFSKYYKRKGTSEKKPLKAAQNVKTRPEAHEKVNTTKKQAAKKSKPSMQENDSGSELDDIEGVTIDANGYCEFEIKQYPSEMHPNSRFDFCLTDQGRIGLLCDNYK